MLVFAWALTAVLGGLSMFLLATNYVLGPLEAARGDRGYSFIPFAGGLLGAAACLVCPLPGSSWAAPALLVIDITIPLGAKCAVRELLALRGR